MSVQIERLPIAYLRAIKQHYTYDDSYTDDPAEHISLPARLNHRINDQERDSGSQHIPHCRLVLRGLGELGIRLSMSHGLMVHWSAGPTYDT